MNDREWSEHLQMTRDLAEAKQTLAKAEGELREALKAHREVTGALRALVDVCQPGPLNRTLVFAARVKALGTLQAWGAGQ